MCWVLCLYGGRRYENNDIFPNFFRHFCCIYHLAGWQRTRPLAAWLQRRLLLWRRRRVAIWLAQYRLSRWPKRAGCSYAVQSFTKSNCSDPTGRNSLFYITATSKRWTSTMHNWREYFVPLKLHCYLYETSRLRRLFLRLQQFDEENNLQRKIIVEKRFHTRRPNRSNPINDLHSSVCCWHVYAVRFSEWQPGIPS